MGESLHFVSPADLGFYENGTNSPFFESKVQYPLCYLHSLLDNIT